MNRRTARAAGLVALLMGAGTLVQPVHAAAPAPQNTCSGAFCVTFDLVTLRRPRADPADHRRGPAHQPGPPVHRHLLRGRHGQVHLAREGLGGAGLDVVEGVRRHGSRSAAARRVRRRHGGHREWLRRRHRLRLRLPGRLRNGTGRGRRVCSRRPSRRRPSGSPASPPVPAGALTAELTVRIDGELLPSTTTTPLTFSPATATAGPTLTMDTRPAVTPPAGYLSAELSLNTVALNLNGLVTEAAAGAVNPPVAFVRQSPLCTTVTATLAANARGTATAASAFPQGVKDCPASPDLVSVVPDPTNPRAFTFTMKPPTAAVAGRTASLEYVFGDGAKAVAGASTSHTYPVTSPVVALVTVLDSAGARSTALQVKIGAAAVRGKQKEGNLVIGSVTDQDTGVGLGDQEVLAYRCDTRHTPISPVRLRRDGDHPVDGEVPPQDPRGQEEGLRARRVRRHRDHLEQPARALRSGPLHRRAASTGGDPQALPEAGTSRAARSRSAARSSRARRGRPSGSRASSAASGARSARPPSPSRAATRWRTSSGSPAATRSRSAPWSTAPPRRCWPRVR